MGGGVQVDVKGTALTTSPNYVADRLNSSTKTNRCPLIKG